jgi:hypothetical protein
MSLAAWRANACAHAQVGMAALARGAHLLLEKPFAESLQQADKHGRWSHARDATHCVLSSTSLVLSENFTSWRFSCAMSRAGVKLTAPPAFTGR